MPHYLVLLYASEGDEAEEERRWAQLPLWLELTEGLREAGLLVANGALHRTDAATTVRVRNGETEITDGPFAVTKEVLAGFYLHLIFNEGYSASAGDQLTRSDLCAEATRLGRLLVELMPAQAEAWGLLALMLLHDARRAARTGPSGYVALGDQDRSLWDYAQIADGLRALERAVRFRHPGQYQLQAAITALHIQAADPGATDWTQIADLYAALGRLSPSPVVEVNHTAAVGFARGPQAGLELLRPLLADPALREYQPLHATHADLLNRAGDHPAAARAYLQAITLTQNAVAQAELRRRLDALTSR